MGFMLLKAAMTLRGTCSPLILTCMVIQLYALGAVHRLNVQDTNTRFSTKIFVYTMLYITAQQYFYHSRHKEELANFNTHRLCGWKCPNALGIPMQYLELWWPNICVLFLLPFVVKQQVGIT